MMKHKYMIQTYLESPCRDLPSPEQFPILYDRGEISTRIQVGILIGFSVMITTALIFV